MGFVLCSTEFTSAERISDSSRKNRSPCRLTQLGKSNQFVYQVVDELDKTTEQKINQIIPLGKNVCMKDLRVPTVQLKLLNFFYRTG